MTEKVSNNNPSFPSVRETIRKFNMYGKTNGFLCIPNKSKNYTNLSSPTTSTSRSTLSGNTNKIEQPLSTTRNNRERSSISSSSVPTDTSPTVIYKDFQVPRNNHSNDIGLEVIESVPPSRKQTMNNNESHGSIHCAPSVIGDYGENDIEQSRDFYRRTPPPPPPPLPPFLALPNLQDESNSSGKRSLALSTFLLEIGALVVVFILCMVLVLAIREEQINLRITMQIVYTYIYLISIIWMIWCTYDIIKFRRHWIKLTSSADNQGEYMDIVERHPQNISYFPDIHNTGGLFMRIGAGLLCMGSLLLTIIELAKTIEMIRTASENHRAYVPTYSKSVFVTKSITFLFRFLFHCVQFTFLFQYGNIIIDRYHSIAKIGLIHIIIANFCTWFEAIVIETLEELHKQSGSVLSTTTQMTLNTTKSVELTTIPYTSSHPINLFKAAPSEDTSPDNSTTNAFEFLEKIQLTLGVYLYPCLIEYSLISITVFYIMWRNVGQRENRIFLHFADRHIFTVNCSRASCGLLFGGIIFLLTIITLISGYIVDPSLSIPITHITELVLFLISLLIVSILFIYTTKLYYDRQARVDIFDQILILVTTVGDFAYSFFGLFAAIFIQSYALNIPRFIEVSISFLAIFQTFLQSAFILDALKRRTRTKNEIRKKPGRELITALLLINLAIWLHDSLSANKVKLNPLQSEYYGPGTWSIVQAFTSPLSIFYRFHSSVCLADIWQEVYLDHGSNRPRGKDEIHQSIKINNNEH